ncbi:Scr1 family TA system antitoxin-like transcriptional regulator [Glycomyces buryatensis]|nr:Scr1 family TA system antitoxin-like transcriptional regulator [Glycomyces buryatensis]
MAFEDSGGWFLKTMVRKHRIASGATQQAIADELFYSPDTIRAWELGRATIPLKMLARYAKACGVNDEIIGYMVQVAIARREGKPVEADMRFNALFMSLAEEFFGSFFKFDATFIPGPLQLKEYHDLIVRPADPEASDDESKDGWVFKEARRIALEDRPDQPMMSFLIGEAALVHLRRFSEELYQKQMAYLRKWAKRPGVSIRILREPVPVRMSGFSIYQPEDMPRACPPFVYTEIADTSWCIDDPDRIARYDELRKRLWKMAIRIEVYRDDDRRDRMA